MRLLYVSFIQPSEKFGGGLVVLQTLSTLCKFAEVDYIGLEYDEREFQKYSIKVQEKYIVSANTSLLDQLHNALKYHYTSSYYGGWVEACKQLNVKKYDYVYMDFTRHNFVADWAYNNRIPLLIRAHNVEADYSKSMFDNNKTLRNFIRKYASKISEEICVNRAEKIIVLTESDRKRFISLYGGDYKKYPIIPVCVKPFETEIYNNKGKKYILITGSLWFGPNADGTKWFLENVWSVLQTSLGDEYDLIIAGAKPNSFIVDAPNKYDNVKVFSSPERIGPFYMGASVYIAPIFYGAGMKVKVAEALSCGLPVVATSHALTGYEAVRDLTYSADTAIEYIQNINFIVSNDIKNEGAILDAFENNYSFKASERKLRDIISKQEG